MQPGSCKSRILAGNEGPESVGKISLAEEEKTPGRRTPEGLVIGSTHREKSQSGFQPTENQPVRKLEGKPGN